VKKQKNLGLFYHLVRLIEEDRERELKILLCSKDHKSKWKAVVGLLCDDGEEQRSLLEVACIKMNLAAINYLVHLGAPWTVDGFSAANRGR